jgi:hypothetical protein
MLGVLQSSLPCSHNFPFWGWGAGGPWNSDSLHHLTRQWPDKITAHLKLGNKYKSWTGRQRGEAKLRLVDEGTRRMVP